MKKIGIYPEITKKYILDKISQEDIMERFLHIPVNAETQMPNSINSPFRVDKNPSCNYWYNDNGKLRIKDWTDMSVNYDCFDVVAWDLKTSSRSKQGFVLVLHEIAKSFGLNKYVNKEEIKNFEKFKLGLKTKKRSKNILVYKVELRKPNYHDVAYWGKYELNIKDTKGVYYIQSIQVSVNNYPYKIIYRYSPKDVCYGYYGGKHPTIGHNLWKFYFPFRKKRDDSRGSKFITNGVFMQGIQYMKPAKFCIITKSYKDSLVFNKLGFSSSSLSAETIIPSKKDLLFLKTNYDFVITCLDWDRTGIRMTKLLRDKHNFIPYMFTRGYFNTIDYKAKDASDFVELESLSTLHSICKKEYNYHKEEIDKYLKTINDKIKFI